MRGSRSLLQGSAVFALFLSVLVPAVAAQEVAQQAAVIDTVIIERDNVFTEEEAASSVS